MSADAVRPTPAQALGAADLAAHRHLRGHLHHIDRLTPSATPRSFQLLTSCSFPVRRQKSSRWLSQADRLPACTARFSRHNCVGPGDAVDLNDFIDRWSARRGGEAGPEQGPPRAGGPGACAPVTCGHGDGLR